MLARAINRPFYDSDSLVEKTTGQTIAEIFEFRGEAYFRHKEALAVAGLLNLKSAVISIGGGAILDKHISKLLQAHKLIYLDVPLDVIWQRLEHDGSRPHLNVKNKYEVLENIYQKRSVLYHNIAHLTVHTKDEGPADIATKIAEDLNFSIDKTFGDLCIK